jgi:xyloglucan-specific exo-beta-1,4-glucanase
VASFPAVGTYRQNPNDASGYQSDIMGISFVTFDSGSKAEQGGEARSARIFAGVASLGEDNLFVSQDGGATWRPVEGLNSTFMPVRGELV